MLQQSTDFGKAGCGAHTSCLRVDDAIKTIAGALTTIEKRRRNQRSKALLDGLIDREHINTGFEGDEGWIWL